MAHDIDTEGAFDATLYEAALAEKHHYDNLSWTIGAIALIGAGVLLAAVTQVTGNSYFDRLPSRLALAGLAILLLAAWRAIYERNRFWAEVANEKLRDLERARGIEGVTLSFMQAALTHKIVLKNVDIDGNALAKPHVESCRESSMHINVNLALWLAIVLALVFAVLP